MATFTEIYYNGNEYKQMWLNGVKVWEKDSGGGEIVYPYPDCDSVVTYANTDASSQSMAFNIIDNTLPYSINGVNTDTFSFPASSETQLKFVNLKPCSNDSYVVPINIEQLRIPNLTDLSNLIQFFGYDSSYEYSWSPQYFEFHPNPTVMEYMFYYCCNLTYDMMAQFMPYFPNTSEVTNMSHLFGSCNSLTSLDVSSFDTSSVTNMREMFYTCSSLTSLDLSNFDTSNVTTMEDMFRYCSSLTELVLSNFDTRNVTNMNGMFQYVSNCTIYIGENWTLGTEPTFGGGSNLTFIRVAPITNITLESTLTDTTITKGTQFTITPTITPINYGSDELVITYDENYLSMVDNTFTVLDTATIGQQLDITYSSKNNPSVSTTYSVTIRDIAYIESISLTHTLETLTDVDVYTTFTVVPTIEPTSHDDELLVDYDTSYLSKDGDSYTVLGGASGQTVQVIYYSKHDNNVNAMIEFTVAEKVEKEPILTTYTTFNELSNSSYCSFTTDTEANTMTIKFTYTGSSYYSNIYTKLDTILPRKCRVRITGESQGTRKYMNVDNVNFPTNSIICLSATASGNLDNAWWGSHSMPSDGIVYNNGATQTTSEALDYNEIILYQLNPNQYYLASPDTGKFYPFEYDFTYCFPSEPRLYLNYETHYGGAKGAIYKGTYVTYKDLKIEVYEYPIESIYLTTDEDVNNITNAKFTINSTILPSLYSDNDLEIIYDETYMKIDVDTGKVKLKDGCQGLTHTVTYRSKSDNSISKSITFTVPQDLEIGMDAIDYTQSTAPTLPDCMTLDGQGSSYYFSHGTYTSGVYGLVPNNKNKDNTIAYTRYKFIAPKDGALTFTYRCYAETNYDYLTVHVDTSTSQPNYTSSTNRVFATKGVSSYENTDGTASVNVTSGTTYYIHIQYRKDKSGSNGYDKGCIRKIELL